MFFFFFLVLVASNHNDSMSRCWRKNFSFSKRMAISKVQMFFVLFVLDSNVCVGARGQTGKCTCWMQRGECAWENCFSFQRSSQDQTTIKKIHSTNSGYDVTNARQTRDKFPKSGHGQTEQFKNLVDARNVRYLLGCRTTGVTECDTAITLIWFTRDKKCFSRSRTRKMKIFFPRRAIWSVIFLFKFSSTAEQLTIRV